MNRISQGNSAAGRRRDRDTKKTSETERQGTETKTKYKIGRQAYREAELTQWPKKSFTVT